MFRFVVLTCAVVACTAQFVDPKDAKILKEQRFNVGDGRAGSAFATEDGTVFREETDLDGNRVGQYSYIGDDGKTYTVKYTAGKDGFRIIDGTHVPKGANGQQAAAFNPEENVPQQPQQALPARAAQPVQQARPVIDYDYEQVEEDPNRNPFVNPHDPTHRDFSFNRNGAKFAPQSAGAPVHNTFDSNLVPNCADCAGVNPFVNPFDSSHSGVLAGHLAGHQAPVAPRRQRPQEVPVFRPTIRQDTTPSPARFFPPGQLKLSRFETGFNFDFES